MQKSQLIQIFKDFQQDLEERGVSTVELMMNHLCYIITEPRVILLQFATINNYDIDAQESSSKFLTKLIQTLGTVSGLPSIDSHAKNSMYFLTKFNIIRYYADNHADMSIEDIKKLIGDAGDYSILKDFVFHEYTGDSTFTGDMPEFAIKIFINNCCTNIKPALLKKFMDYYYNRIQLNSCKHNHNAETDAIKNVASKGQGLFDEAKDIYTNRRPVSLKVFILENFDKDSSKKILSSIFKAKIALRLVGPRTKLKTLAIPALEFIIKQLKKDSYASKSISSIGGMCGTENSATGLELKNLILGLNKDSSIQETATKLKDLSNKIKYK